MGSNKPRRHHIIPRVLLRHFADNGRVLAAPTADGAIGTRSISDATVVSHANTMDTDVGKDFVLEALLSQIEANYPAIVSSLSKRVRTNEEDGLVLALVATQIGRDPAIRRGFIEDEVATIYEALENALRERNPEISDDAIIEELDFYGRHHIVKSHIKPVAYNVAIAGTTFLIRKFFEDFAARQLTVLKATDGQFITADSAVSIFPDYDESVYASEEAFMRGTEVLLPITPQYAALITSNLPQETIAVGRDIVAIVNARTARTGGRHVYAHPSYPPEKLRMDLTGWWAPRSLVGSLK